MIGDDEDDLEARLLGDVAPSTQSLSDLEALVREHQDLKTRVDQTEQYLKEQKEALQRLEENTIPSVMTAAGVSKFVTTSGAKISVNSFARGTLPKDPQRRAEALDLITSYGGENIIQFSFELNFARGNRERLNEVLEKLRSLKIIPQVEEGVHPQTLAKFCRERLEAGEPVDTETLGVYLGRKAKITLPKDES